MITNCDDIAHCDRESKLRRALHIATGITNCDGHYTLRRGLQIATGITHCDRDYKLRRVLHSKPRFHVETARAVYVFGGPI